MKKLLSLLFAIFIGYASFGQTYEQRKAQYQKDIDKDKTFIEQMADTTEMENYARAQYYLKKENETIYIIDHQDSLQNQD